MNLNPPSVLGWRNSNYKGFIWVHTFTSQRFVKGLIDTTCHKPPLFFFFLFFLTSFRSERLLCGPEGGVLRPSRWFWLTPVMSSRWRSLRKAPLSTPLRCLLLVLCGETNCTFLVTPVSFWTGWFNKPRDCDSRVSEIHLFDKTNVEEEKKQNNPLSCLTPCGVYTLLWCRVGVSEGHEVIWSVHHFMLFDLYVRSMNRFPQRTHPKNWRDLSWTRNKYSRNYELIHVQSWHDVGSSIDLYICTVCSSIYFKDVQ